MPSVYGVTYVVRCCHAKGWWHAKGGWMLRKSTHAMPPPPTPTVCAPTVPSLCQACTHPSLPPSVPRTAAPSLAYPTCRTTPHAATLCRPPTLCRPKHATQLHA